MIDLMGIWRLHKQRKQHREWREQWLAAGFDPDAPAPYFTVYIWCVCGKRKSHHHFTRSNSFIVAGRPPTTERLTEILLEKIEYYKNSSPGCPNPRARIVNKRVKGEVVLSYP